MNQKVPKSSYITITREGGGSDPKIDYNIALNFSHFPHLGLPKLNTNNLRYYTILKADFLYNKIIPYP